MLTALAFALLACSPSPTPDAPASPTPEAPPPAPTPEAAPADAAPTEIATPAIAGGYGPVEVDDAVRQAATFAVSQLGRAGATLTRVDNAQQQVVAGLNLRLDLTLSDGSRWRVVVFRSLDQQLSLSSREALP